METRLSASSPWYARIMAMIMTEGVKSMRFHRVLIAGLAIMALVGSAVAQTNVGRSGAQFLKVSPSARGVAMSGAYGAVVNSADAVYTNAAGLTAVTGPSVHLSRINYVADINFNYVAFAMPSLGGVLGVQFGSMSSGDMPMTTIDDPTNSSGITFDASSWVLGLSYATPLTDRLSLGVTAKYVHETIWDMKSGTVAFDIGTLYYTGFSNWRFGATLSNFGASARFSGGHLVTQYDKYDDDNQSPTVAEDRAEDVNLPLTFKLSTAYDFVISDQMQITTCFEGAHPNDAPEYLAGGLEYKLTAPMASLALRGGYRLTGTEDMGNYSEQQMTADGVVLGAGLTLPFIARELTFDYTWQDYTKLGTNHIFSLSMNF